MPRLGSGWNFDHDGVCWPGVRGSEPIWQNTDAGQDELNLLLDSHDFLRFQFDLMSFGAVTGCAGRQIASFSRKSDVNPIRDVRILIARRSSGSSMFLGLLEESAELILSDPRRLGASCCERPAEF